MSCNMDRQITILLSFVDIKYESCVHKKFDSLVKFFCILNRLDLYQKVSSYYRFDFKKKFNLQIRE